MFLVALVFTLALTVRGDLPDSFDLRTAYPKCIPPVKNSGQCGAAMIFAGVDGLSINFCTASHGNQLIPLSADFVEICEANGCNGEDPETIIDFFGSERHSSGWMCPIKCMCKCDMFAQTE